MERLIRMGRCLLAAIALVFAGFAPVEPSVRGQDPQLPGPVIEMRADNERPRETRWLDRVAEFFRLPVVNVALVAVGLIGLIFEFKLPGTTLPGAVAAFCFVLFFWAFSFVGQFTLLAILLFLLGLILLGVEVFVVPGLGFSGVAGAMLMFVSLLLVTLDHWPNDSRDWTHVGSTFGSLAIGLALAIVGAVALTWSLPGVPFLNAMVLKPPMEEADADPLSLSNSGPVSLLGAIGVAVTHLRPSGKAQFGEQFLDVMADSSYVPPGVRVKVVEIDGQRVLVKEV